MDAVYIVPAGNLFADVGQIGGGLWFFRIQVALRTNLAYQSGIALAQPLASDGVPFADRDGDHPGM